MICNYPLGEPRDDADMGVHDLPRVTITPRVAPACRLGPTPDLSLADRIERETAAGSPSFINIKGPIQSRKPPHTSYYWGGGQNYQAPTLQDRRTPTQAPIVPIDGLRRGLDLMDREAPAPAKSRTYSAARFQQQISSQSGQGKAPPSNDVPTRFGLDTRNHQQTSHKRKINKHGSPAPSLQASQSPQASHSSPYNGRDGSDDEVNDGGSGVH